MSSNQSSYEYCKNIDKYFAGTECTEEILPNKPEIELNKMKTAAVPDAPLTLVHPKKIISGDKKIPPPVPVRPDSKPIKTPINTAPKGLNVLFLFTYFF